MTMKMVAIGVFASLVILAALNSLLSGPSFACVETNSPLRALGNNECARVVGTAQRKVNVNFGVDFWLIQTNRGQALAEWNDVCADNPGLLLVGESINGFYRKTGERVVSDQEGQPVRRIPEVGCEPPHKVQTRRSATPSLPRRTVRGE